MWWHTDVGVSGMGYCLHIGCYNDDEYGTYLGDEVDEVGDGIPMVASFGGVVDVAALYSMVCVLGQNGNGRDHFIECVGWDERNVVWRSDQTDSAWTVSSDSIKMSYPVVTTADSDTAHLDLSGLSWTPSGFGGGWHTLCVFDSTTEGALECYVSIV